MIRLTRFPTLFYDRRLFHCRNSPAEHRPFRRSQTIMYADLYDPDVMPSELYSAINRNNSAVMRAYGFNVSSMSETDCVAELMKMYQKLVETQQ